MQESEAEKIESQWFQSKTNIIFLEGSFQQLIKLRCGILITKKWNDNSKLHHFYHFISLFFRWQHFVHCCWDTNAMQFCWTTIRSVVRSAVLPKIIYCIFNVSFGAQARHSPLTVATSSTTNTPTTSSEQPSTVVTGKLIFKEKRRNTFGAGMVVEWSFTAAFNHLGLSHVHLPNDGSCGNGPGVHEQLLVWNCAGWYNPIMESYIFTPNYSIVWKNRVRGAFLIHNSL